MILFRIFSLLILLLAVHSGFAHGTHKKLNPLSVSVLRSTGEVHTYLHKFLFDYDLFLKSSFDSDGKSFVVFKSELLEILNQCISHQNQAIKDFDSKRLDSEAYDFFNLPEKYEKKNPVKEKDGLAVEYPEELFSDADFLHEQVEKIDGMLFNVSLTELDLPKDIRSEMRVVLLDLVDVKQEFSKIKLK